MLGCKSCLRRSFRISVPAMPPLTLLRCYFVFAIIAGGLSAGCQHAAAPTAPAVTNVPPVKPLQAELVTVASRPWKTVIRSQGGLIADEVTVIGAKVAGRVARIAVDLGDFVQQGDVIAELDLEELQLRVRQAEAELSQARAAIGLTPDRSDDDVNREKSPVVLQEKAVLEEARANMARFKLLQSRNAATQADLETSEAAVAVAEARYAASLNAVEEKIAIIRVRRAALLVAQDALKQATIRAPFDGLVQARQAASGAYVSVGDPVATLVRIDPLRYSGTVPERHALHLRPGQEVLVHLDGLPEPISTRLTRISPAIEELSRALTFEADIPNSDGRLRSGLFAEAEIVIDSAGQALAVPESSVVEFAGVEKVWQVHEGEAKEVRVQTGRREQGLIEITSGLAKGDLIIVKGSDGRTGPVENATPQESVGG